MLLFGLYVVIFLYFVQKFDQNLVLRSSNNPDKRSMKAIKVISAVLKFLKEKLIESLFKASGYNVKDSDIRWVVTVPAIWKSSARQLMRKAAYEVCICILSHYNSIN